MTVQIRQTRKYFTDIDFNSFIRLFGNVDVPCKLRCFELKEDDQQDDFIRYQNFNTAVQSLDLMARLEKWGYSIRKTATDDEYLSVEIPIANEEVANSQEAAKMIQDFFNAVKDNDKQYAGKIKYKFTTSKTLDWKYPGSNTEFTGHRYGQVEVEECNIVLFEDGVSFTHFGNFKECSKRFWQLIYVCTMLHRQYGWHITFSKHQVLKKFREDFSLPPEMGIPQIISQDKVMFEKIFVKHSNKQRISLRPTTLP